MSTYCIVIVFFILSVYIVVSHEGETVEFQCPKRLGVSEGNNFTLEWYHNNELVNDSSIQERLSFNNIK
jgi:hypothetical protein